MPRVSAIVARAHVSVSVFVGTLVCLCVFVVGHLLILSGHLYLPVYPPDRWFVRSFVRSTDYRVAARSPRARPQSLSSVGGPVPTGIPPPT